MESATTEEELQTILKDLKEKDAIVTDKLNKFVTSTLNSQNHDINKLDLLKTQLNTALSSSHEISKMLTSASYGAGKISSKVRSIEVEKQRVNDSLKYVEDTITLKTSISGCKEAMDLRDWEKAAEFVHQAMILPDELVDGEFANAKVPSTELPEYPRDSINQAADSLGQLFMREFNKAATAKDMENLTRYFKLFPLCGLEKQGLDAYAKFICGIITNLSRSIMQNTKSSAETKVPFYGKAMSRLFENIASIIAQHAPIVERHYGKGRMCRVVDRIQDEADSQGGLIMDTLWDERRIDRLISEIRSYPYTFLVNSFAGISSATSAARNSSEIDAQETVDLKHVGDLCFEMSIMFNRWTLYKKFIADRWDEFGGETAAETPHPPHVSPPPPPPQFLLDSNFNKKLTTKLSPCFEQMALFVSRRSVEKAFQLEELPDLMAKSTPDSPLVSSVVHDVMLVFSSLVNQTLNTGEMTLIKTVISGIRRVLESDYVGFVQRKLRDGAPRQTPIRTATPPPNSNTKSLAGLPNSEDRKLRTFMVNLNGLTTISSYVEQVVDPLHYYYDDNLPFGDDATEAKNIMNSLSTSFKGRCIEIANDGLRTIFNFVLKPKLTTLFNTITKLADYLTNNEGEEDLSEKFTIGWKELMKEFANILTPENYTRLVSLAAQSLSKALERWVWSLEGKVNELGAIRLDRDVGRIITTLSQQYHFREKFVRVAQIVTVIGLDDSEDEESVAWALTEDERVKARNIRIDRNY